VFRENEKLLWKAAVPPMMLTAEIRVSPDDPAKTLTAPPLAVEPNVVADVDNRAWQRVMMLSFTEMLLRRTVVLPTIPLSNATTTDFKLNDFKPM
jgi:hypothetical protein